MDAVYLILKVAVAYFVVCVAVATVKVINDRRRRRQPTIGDLPRRRKQRSSEGWIVLATSFSL